MATTPTQPNAVELLSSLWQRIFQIPVISPDSNFFDLGGDLPKALQLFDEIAKLTGRRLPAILICQAPTISTLAPFLSAGGSPALVSCVLLKAGTKKTPAFVTHGIGGSVLEFMPMVRRLNSQRTFYGLQAKGTDGRDAPLDTIEAMAEFHLRDLRRIQPRGPHILIGYSLGGLVALEMAQRLAAQGDAPALLVLVEAYPDSQFVSFSQRLGIRTRVAKHHARNMLSLSPPKAISYLLHSSERQQLESQQRAKRGGTHLTNLALLAPGMPQVRDAAYLALQRYRPARYDGKVHFIKAASSLYFPDDPRAVWSPYIKNFEQETVPGDHLGVLELHFADLAQLLSRYLRTVDAIE